MKSACSSSIQRLSTTSAVKADMNRHLRRGWQGNSPEKCLSGRALDFPGRLVIGPR
ncbi:MAG: hypothetical protein U5O15_00040 [Candidatus Krumholzibacteriota bacterium]|nr:hypothetical protein [Candidatus Krumholzibacteriota bacterium]